MLSKKDYKMLASVITAAREDAVVTLCTKDGLNQPIAVMIVDGYIGKLLVRLCNALSQDNRNFDSDKFYDAVYQK